MGRVKSPSPERHRPHGRPPVRWTPRRKRRLLRLYLGTPASLLSLQEIRSILQEDGFRPEQRKTQQVLQSLLSKSYNQKRPAGREEMKKRLSFFRAIRRNKSTQCPTPKDQALSPILPEHGGSQVADSCANIGIAITCDSMATTLDTLYLPRYYDDGYGAMVDDPVAQLVRIQPSAKPDKVTETVGPNMRDSLQSATRLPRRSSMIESLRRKLSGSRSSSAFGSIASILRNSFSSSLLSSVSERASKSQGIREEITAVVPGDLPSMSDEDLAVLQACCGTRRLTQVPCVHRRLKQILAELNLNGNPMDFQATAEELASTDRLGNTVLHVAARWQAPLRVLGSMIQQGANPNLTNNLRQTFMHLLKPWQVSTQAEAVFQLANLLSDRRYNFCLRDDMGATFVQKWTLSGSMNIPILEVFLAALPQFAVHQLLNDKTSTGTRFLNWTTRNLGLSNTKVDLSTYVSAVRKKYAQTHTFIPPSNKGGGYWVPMQADKWADLRLLVSCVYLREAWVALESSGCEADTKYLEVLDAFLERCPREQLNQRDESGATPIMALLAAWRGDPSDEFLQKLTARLLRAGASLHHRDDRGYTPLHCAVDHQLPDVVLQLCKAGANVNALSEDGLTPLGLSMELVHSGGKPTRCIECGVVLADFRSMGSQSKAREEWKKWFNWSGYYSSTVDAP